MHLLRNERFSLGPLPRAEDALVCQIVDAPDRGAWSKSADPGDQTVRPTDISAETIPTASPAVRHMVHLGLRGPIAERLYSVSGHR